MQVEEVMFPAAGCAAIYRAGIDAMVPVPAGRSERSAP